MRLPGWSVFNELLLCSSSRGCGGEQEGVGSLPTWSLLSGGFRLGQVGWRQLGWAHTLWEECFLLVSTQQADNILIYCLLPQLCRKVPNAYRINVKAERDGRIDPGPSSISTFIWQMNNPKLREGNGTFNVSWQQYQERELDCWTPCAVLLTHWLTWMWIIEHLLCILASSTLQWGFTDSPSLEILKGSWVGS